MKLKVPSLSGGGKKVALLILVALLFLSVLYAYREDLKAIVGLSVCGEQEIDDYNQATLRVDDYANNIKSLAKKIQTKRNHTKDMTCVYIVYQHYSYIQDANTSRELLETLKNLEQKGKHVNPKILSPKSIKEIEAHVKSLEYNRDLGDRADGSG